MTLPDATQLIRPITIAVSAILLLGGAGCNGSVSEEIDAQNDRLAAELKGDIRRSGEYTQVTVVYADDATNQRKLGISIRCKSCHPATVLNKALRAAWQSRIAPLLTIRVSVLNVTTLEDADEYVYLYEPEDVQKMVEKYGKRRVESTPSY